MPENCPASIVGCIACASRCRRSLEKPTASGFTLGSASTDDAAPTSVASVSTHAIKLMANEPERFILIPPAFSFLTAASFLRRRRRLPFDFRQIGVDAGPRRRLRCPDRGGRLRDCRIVERAGAHE